MTIVCVGIGCVWLEFLDVARVDGQRSLLDKDEQGTMFVAEGDLSARGQDDAGQGQAELAAGHGYLERRERGVGAWRWDGLLTPRRGD
jgi:hypothetical protein